jgi:hypothetical protein
MCGAVAWLKQSSAKNAVAIIPDAGANYLVQIYNNEWLAEKGTTLLSRRELGERLQAKSVFDAECLSPVKKLLFRHTMPSPACEHSKEIKSSRQFPYATYCFASGSTSGKSGINSW